MFYDGLCCENLGEYSWYVVFYVLIFVEYVYVLILVYCLV